MKTLEQQVQEQIETQPEFVVLLNSHGIITFSNQDWIIYCRNHLLSNYLWEAGRDYLTFINDNKMIEALHYIKNVLSGDVMEYIQFSSFQTKQNTKNFSIKYRQFQSDDGDAGVIMHIQPIEFSPPEALNKDLILENMTDALYILDDKMNFQYLNSKTESLLNIKKEELLGNNIWNMFPQLVGTAFYSNYKRARKEQTSIQFAEYYGPLDSWYEVRVIPLADGGLAIYYQKIDNYYTTDKKDYSQGCTDYLTCWSTRLNFAEKAEQILQANTLFSLFYINLDNFKHINTLFDHQTGDEVIKCIAKKLEEILLPNELAGRLDGDELVLLHVHEKGENPEFFAQKVTEIFAHPIFLKNGQSIIVDASIGISLSSMESQSINEMVTFAETAMRDAKKQAGASYSLFQPSMAKDLSRRLLIEQDLSGDLKANGFHFALQPQINCSTGEVDGIEVLSRCLHPELGHISPVEFIEIAEETGTISHLTNYLLNEVFTFINSNKKSGIELPKTAINITPSLLTSKIFFDDLFQLMEKYQIPAEMVELEITESVELTVSEITLQNLRACRSKGISIALDDFGTGFSMLAYLMDFPIDKIKLDKSFISKIGYDQKSDAVLKSLIQFVQSIGCKLVAEGVETKGESSFLEMSGCSIHQGYFYERPLLPEKFIKSYILEEKFKVLKAI